MKQQIYNNSRRYVEGTLFLNTEEPEITSDRFHQHRCDASLSCTDVLKFDLSVISASPPDGANILI